MANTKKATKTAGKGYEGFSEEERDAMKERAKELKAEARSAASGAASGAAKADPEAEQLAKIAELAESDRVLAERLHAIVMKNAPGLTPKLWYGMPGWARNGKIVCFFTPAAKFKTRYATLGFNQDANLDEGNMWPTSFALTKLTAADEKKIAALVKKAVS
jgi:uncharacterized protein YdhG (YjbR/CyaY superfamily)